MTANTLTAIPVRLDFDAHAAIFARAMNHLDHAATKQLNGCAYCVDMHSKNLRAVGETQLRLDALPVWPEAPFFSEAERAALAFAEAMVRMADSHVPSAAYSALAEHYGPDEIAALVALVVTVTAWNAIGVSTRTWEPGSYQP